MMNGKNQILIGTSGYDYPEWKGVFYPEDAARKDFLSYYASQFNVLELNNTFYNMPTAQRMISFYERSGGELNFSVKANRLITHQAGPEWKTDSKAFMDALAPVLEKQRLAAVLFQFPQSFHYTDSNRIFLSNVLEQFKSFLCVVEFRHVEWLKESVFAGLEKRNVSLAFCDMPGLKNLPAMFSNQNDESRNPQVQNKIPLTGPIAYFRLHGRNAGAWYANDSSPNGSSRYNYDYSDSELKDFLPVIKRTWENNKNPMLLFNNHPGGNGARNAQRLKEMLGGQM